MVMFKEGQIVAWGVRIVTIQGLTKMRGGRKYYYVLELWSEQDRKFRMEQGNVIQKKQKERCLLQRKVKHRGIRE